MHKTVKRYFLGLAIIILLSGLAFVIIKKAPTPPIPEMKIAQEALSSAQKANAQVYARDAFKQAQLAYDSAMKSWSAENGRFFLFRDYSQVNNWITVAIEKADEAQKLSGKRSRSTSSRVKEGLILLEKKADIFRRYYKKMPLPTSISETYNRGILKLSEARHAWENHHFAEAEKHYSAAWELINKAENRTETLVRKWLESQANWQQLAKQAVQMSANNKKIILIDKFAHTCTIYQNKKPLRIFSIELGPNWMGDKIRKGDKATPEGIYRITEKKKGSETKFHKALLISYPNNEDVQRFQVAKNNGLVSAKTEIGGLIEIHGSGGKGIDWTDGCIALENNDMDVLFRLVAVNTPVIIVGSVEPLDKLLNLSQLK